METDIPVAAPQPLAFKKVSGVPPPKRLIVRDFKGIFSFHSQQCLFFAVKPKLPEDFEDITWEKLRAAILAVEHKAPVNCSLEELYKVRVRHRLPLKSLQAVENLCIHKLAAGLFSKLEKQCELHIANEVQRLLKYGDVHDIGFLTSAQSNFRSGILFKPG